MTAQLKELDTYEVTYIPYLPDPKFEYFGQSILANFTQIALIDAISHYHAKRRFLEGNHAEVLTVKLL